MSTAGLRKVGNYEETLAAAIKDESHVAGIINPYLELQPPELSTIQNFKELKIGLKMILHDKPRCIWTKQTSNIM